MSTEPTLRDEIRAGNLAVSFSKRFGRFDHFFISKQAWNSEREAFFKRAGLPVHVAEIPGYLTQRLNQAYEQFLTSWPDNKYAQVNEMGWVLTSEEAQKLEPVTQARLDSLKNWLASHLRHIKLPQLLIEVDNELHFTHSFWPVTELGKPSPETICHIMATIMAYGCNLGPYTMAHLTSGITYHQIKRMTDWYFSEETQRQALAQVVKAIAQLEVTAHWGDGTTSSSDGQKFRYTQQTLQQTWSPTFQDYALEFYSFIADNYAPFYSLPIECTDRDAAYVLDGLLYNESELPLEEHFTDTHGYTEINFAAFALLGRRFSPRIRALHRQRIYYIDPLVNYGALSPLLPKNRQLHLEWITSEWDELGRFYASLACGHTTASTALKRLVGYTGKNRFYQGTSKFRP